eukprot:12939_6
MHFMCIVPKQNVQKERRFLVVVLQTWQACGQMIVTFISFPFGRHLLWYVFRQVIVEHLRNSGFSSMRSLQIKQNLWSCSQSLQTQFDGAFSPRTHSVKTLLQSLLHARSIS